MEMRPMVSALLLTTVIVAGANADWDYRAAEPQEFEPFDDYVIAVGTADNLETVQASDIQTALKAGKQIRLEYVEIKGNIALIRD